MDDLLKITKDTLSSIFSTIKKNVKEIAQSEADKKDNAIIAAALNGKYIIRHSGTPPTEAKKNGALSYNTATGKFYYYLGGTFTEIKLSHILNLISTSPVRTNQLIPTSIWATATPFNILDGVVTSIYKGEAVGDYTKWILIPFEDSEDQTYRAYKKGNSKYVYGTYIMAAGNYNGPWELWLPSNLAAKSVEVDW